MLFGSFLENTGSYYVFPKKNIDIPASICYNYYKTQGKYRKSSDKMVLSIVIHTGGKEYAGKFAAYGRMVRGIL